MVDMNLEQARFNMIQQQVRPWDVLDDRVLELMTRLPREDFVPDAYRNIAFTDVEIPLGHDQVMLAPKMEGRILQAVNPKADDTVLEVGTGGAFLTALLASTARLVYSVDIEEEFVEQAREKLAKHNIRNVTLWQGDAARGWHTHAPYDVIAVTGSLPELHEDFQKDLKIGGRMFAVVGEAPVMEAQLITRIGENEWRHESLFETELPALIHARKTPHFEL